MSIPMRSPVMDDLGHEWFAAAAQGRLLIQRCASCGHAQFYPRGHCTKCFSFDMEWHTATGTGRLHTWSEVMWTGEAEFASDCPYVLAIVELDEGVLVTSRIVDSDPASLQCDEPVCVTFRDIGGQLVLPVFTVQGVRT
jgi:uncharacterized OB-fold protein